MRKKWGRYRTWRSWRHLLLMKFWTQPLAGFEKGFDFLGYHFNPAGLTVAHETFVRFVARAIRLYEQEPG